MASAPKILTHTLSGDFVGVKSITITEAYNSTMSQAIIECRKFTGSLGDSITFDMGYSGDSGKIFTGYIRNIDVQLPSAETRVVAEDELSKATEYFMAATDPQNPFTRSHIQTEDLVEDILNEAQITNYAYNVPLSVTWGTQGELEFNLVTAWQAASTIVDALAWHLYADRNGQVHLVDRPPFDDGDSYDFDWDLSAEEFLTLTHSKSTDNLRNRIVVYGKNNLSASASASSSYLPAGFYKTGVIATQAIDTTTLAQQTADLNLTRMNRLTETITCEVEGDYSIEPRKFVRVTAVDTDTGMNISGSDWFIFHVLHRLDSSGYKCNVTLNK